MNTTMLLRAAVGAVAAASLLAGHTPAAHAQTPPCQFRLGFADLAQLLTARGVVVGPCREDQHPTPNGDAEQRTTRGLMVWRAADNWTAFTDGHQTWVNGPNGLEARLNTQRFSWEPDAGAAGTAVVGVRAPEPPALVPGTQLGVPVSGPTLTMTATGIVRVPGATPGNRLVKVTLKLEGGENSGRLGKYDSWHFRLRSPQGVEYRPSVLEMGAWPATNSWSVTCTSRCPTTAWGTACTTTPTATRTPPWRSAAGSAEPHRPSAPVTG
jgi:hypothetical protein